MALLIDGYNLLHASGIVGRKRGPGGFEQSRLALLNFLAESVPAGELSRTTVVFDATAAPPGLPKMIDHRGIAVRFARDKEGADAMIEELIRADSAPRKLTVVSSDHRIQRAAHRRKATAIDSDRWFAETLRRRQERAASQGTLAPSPPAAPLSKVEVELWLREFAIGDTDDSADEPRAGDSAFNPFPPGYGEDVLDEEG
jgi:predicted RNA-binding protein with PIN domain